MPLNSLKANLLAYDTTIFFTFLYFLPSEAFSMNHVNSYPFHYLSAQTVFLVFFTCNNNCMIYTFTFLMYRVLNCCTLLIQLISNTQIKRSIFSHLSKSKNVHILAMRQNSAVVMSRNNEFVSK